MVQWQPETRIPDGAVVANEDFPDKEKKSQRAYIRLHSNRPDVVKVGIAISAARLTRVCSNLSPW